MNTKQLVLLFLGLAIIATGLLIYQNIQSQNQSEDTGSQTEEELPPEEPKKDAPENNPTKSESELYAELPKDEKDDILNWMEQNNLNVYGDPESTVYTGGTPLFDEETGQRQSVYEYLTENHPNKPWIQSDSEEKEEADEDTSPIPFSKVKKWDRYSSAEYSMEYPVDSNVVNVEPETFSRSAVDVRFTGAKDFQLSVVTDTEAAKTSQCTEVPRFNRFVCHNERTLYKDIYQRMIDSIRRTRL